MEMLTKPETIRVGIFGGSGYGGSELLRILLFHPNAEIVFATANEHAGKLVSDVHRNLFGLTELRFEPASDDISGMPEIDLAFFALPHGQALSLVSQLNPKTKVVDLSGDFRIGDPDVFRQYYKLEHSAIELQSRFVYGLTESNREAIAAAQYVANPGCFATATALALTPLVTNRLLNGKVIVDAKTGSSGSGAKAATNTHHPQRMNSFYAYKPFEHQHVPEIIQHLNAIGNFENELVFMTHSLPLSRGIFASCYAETADVHGVGAIEAIFKEHYRESFFVRMVSGSPDVNWVKNTNFCDIAVHTNGKQLVVFAAIDNLVKGAAGQAVQNMNLMFGLDEKTGLMFTGSNP